MQEHLNFYTDGAWTPAQGTRTLDVIDPSTEQPVARIALGDARDLDHAVAAARRAFPHGLPRAVNSGWPCCTR